ncbi:MAG TPA: hypothetical protein VFY16_10040 [Gemmatimonadaceae bacterium]|nr:hypothetical protein [Gemmatimonadaceae bacterium]
MTWRPRDCHAHSTWSDGELAPAELVEVVVARGARPSIADHVSRDVRRAIRSADTVRRYLSELSTLDVARGAEFCWHDALWRELPDELMAGFTHRLGSLHGVFLPDGTLVHAFQPRLPDGLTPALYMDALVENLVRLAAEMPVDILAHPTLVPVAWRALPPEELWTEANEERAVEALHAAGIAFELSTRFRPHERLVRRAVERGVRLSLGSDGHTREHVGDVVPPLELARRLDVLDEALYDPLVHGSRTLDAVGAVRRR